MILVIQHAACEGPAYLETMMEQRGLRWQVCRSDEGEWPEEIDGYQAMILLGGPQSVNRPDLFPYISREVNLVRAARESSMPVLGICLGAQIIASACGLQVVAGEQKEIGWYPVEVQRGNDHSGLFADVANSFNCFHWHGERILSTPQLASLASTQLTECQACEPAPGLLALQFHLEVTEEAIRSMADGFAKEIASEGITLDELLQDSQQRLAQSHELAQSVIGKWFELFAGKQGMEQGS